MSGMKQKIEDLEKDIKTKDATHQQEIADRDFNDLLKESIASANGKNAKAITALLDVDVLKASKKSERGHCSSNQDIDGSRGQQNAVR